jgi:subtilisin family serine protease
MPSIVYAQVSPRSVGGQPLFDQAANIAKENVLAFTSEAAAASDAVGGLRAAGFDVLQQSPILVNIAGPPERYEDFFSTRLTAREVPVLKPGRVRDTATFLDTVDNDIPGFLDTSRSPAAASLEGGALETMRYPMQAQPPPNPPYRHLDVPDDLVRLLNAGEAHDLGVTGRGVRVVMVDSGWVAQPWFQAHGFAGEVMLGPGADDPDQDENGHGTAESANAFSVAPGIDFTMVKMNFANSTGCFNAAAAMAPRPDVISCSWGTSVPAGPLSPIDQALAASVALAVASGIIVVFAAGNGHFGFPGQHPDVISAGGVFVGADGARTAADYASGFASQVYPGRNVPDLSGLVGMRPKGIYIMLPLPPGSLVDTVIGGGAYPDNDETATDDGWAAISGTSAATPQLAGACALLREAQPGIAPADARAALVDTAVDVTEGSASPDTGSQPAGVGSDLATGAGLLDAGAAVRLVSGSPRPPRDERPPKPPKDTGTPQRELPVGALTGLLLHE